jgi:uncharacterized protein YkwD
MIVAVAGAAHGAPQGTGSNLKGAPQGAGSNLPLPGIGSAFAADATEESCFVSALNAARSSAGLAPLVTNGDLLRVARVWSATMAAAGDISHNPNVANLAPPDWRSLGENVGFGPTCDSVIQAFTGSPEHLKNILDPSYSSLGVGVVDGPDGLMYVTEDFMGTGGASVQAARGPAPRPVQAAPVPVAPPPPPVAEAAAAAPVAVHIPNPTSVPAPRAIPAPAPKPPAPPAPKATAVPVLVALPVMDPALPVEGDAAPGAGLQKGILGGIVNALDAFFAR